MRKETNFTNNAAKLAGQVSLALGWRPQEFWNATPAELGSILEAMAAPHEGMIPTREALEQLMENFPDG